MDRFVAKRRRVDSNLTATVDADLDSVKQLINTSLITAPKFKRIVATDLIVDYGMVLPKSTAKALLEYCERNLTYFSGQMSTVKVFGKTYPIPRKQVAFGDDGLNYSFSGTTISALEWDPVLMEVKNLIGEICGCEFNFVLVNRYANGDDYIGEHRDNEGGLDREAPIASLSIGAERDFLWRHSSTKLQGQRLIGNIKVLLECGSLLVMWPPTNAHWYHSLPKRRSLAGTRINFTFRKMIQPITKYN